MSNRLEIIQLNSTKSDTRKSIVVTEKSLVTSISISYERQIIALGLSIKYFFYFYFLGIEGFSLFSIKNQSNPEKIGNYSEYESDILIFSEDSNYIYSSSGKIIEVFDITDPNKISFIGESVDT